MKNREAALVHTSSFVSAKKKKTHTKNNPLQHTFYFFFFFLANIRWCGRHVLVRAMMPQRHSHADANYTSCAFRSLVVGPEEGEGGRGYGSAPVHDVNGNHYNCRVQIVVSFYVSTFVEKEKSARGLE